MITTPHTWIEISKKALEHNFKMYKQFIGNKLLGVVVKSNAYGHGILDVSRIAQESIYVDWIFTATLSEAMLLRANGISKPILVIYFIDADPIQLITHDIATMVSDLQTLNELNELGITHGKKCKIHLKIDSGMSRFGFLPKEIIEVAKYACSLPGLNVEGIYSHLAQAANVDQSFNREQENTFAKVIEQLAQENITFSYTHISNSAGSTALNPSYTNLVRIGLGMYGWWPSQSNKEITQEKMPEFDLKPVLSFKTKIFQIRKIDADCFVGYDRTYKTSKPTSIAVLPVGYFDGYDRRLSSKGILLIRGQYAPVIGIIAMTTTLVDITHIADACVGDEAILIGNYEKITPTQLANVMGSFNPREILTRLNPTIPRIIVEHELTATYQSSALHAHDPITTGLTV
jgi:alanine racemase